MGNINFYISLFLFVGTDTTSFIPFVINIQFFFVESKDIFVNIYIVFVVVMLQFINMLLINQTQFRFS